MAPVREHVGPSRTGATGPTEIALPARRLHPEGFAVEASDAEGSWSSVWDAERQVLSVTTPQSGGMHLIRIVAGGKGGAR